MARGGDHRFRRTLRRLLAFAPAMSLALAPGSAGHATETNPLKVYGEHRPALQTGIRYWNDLAGRELLHYAGERADESSASTVVVKTGDLDAQMAGKATGVVGATPISLTIGFVYVEDWVVYAHELGHALGFDDYDTDGQTSPYDGVMSYISMWDDPNARADRAMVRERYR